MKYSAHDIQDRWLADRLEKKLTRPYVHIVFGARQTGKSTQLKRLLPDDMLLSTYTRWGGG